MEYSGFVQFLDLVMFGLIEHLTPSIIFFGPCRRDNGTYEHPTKQVWGCKIVSKMEFSANQNRNF